MHWNRSESSWERHRFPQMQDSQFYPFILKMNKIWLKHKTLLILPTREDNFWGKPIKYIYKQQPSGWMHPKQYTVTALKKKFGLIYNYNLGLRSLLCIDVTNDQGSCNKQMQLPLTMEKSLGRRWGLHNEVNKEWRTQRFVEDLHESTYSLSSLSKWYRMFS